MSNFFIMRGFLLLNFMGILVYSTLSEHDYPATNYKDREEWSKFMDVVNRKSSEFGDDINDIADDENPLLCRLGYINEFPFDCSAVPSLKAPASVHELTPADISVIGALGDSLTAAFGMESCTVANLPIEFRGRSWSIGGDEDVSTVLSLANILKTYTPNLKGYSEGEGGPNSEAANLNVAVSGSRAEHMPGQAWELINRIKADPEVDFENDWKMVTVFIGTNDLCQNCLNENKYATEQYVDYMRQALDVMHENLPRTLVSILGIFLIPEYGYYSTPNCDISHYIVCHCGAFQEGDGQIHMWDLTRGYQEQTKALVMSGRYDTNDDFTVVYQPILENTRMPFLDNGEADPSYFAPDCFHFSSRAHAAVAKSIWNNMLQPVGQKNTSWDSDVGIYCPSEDFPYFYTNLNSPESGGTTLNKASGLVMVLCFSAYILIE